MDRSTTRRSLLLPRCCTGTAIAVTNGNLRVARLGGDELVVIALFPDDDLAAQEWVQAADAAVYLAKRQGRNRFAFSRRWRGRVWRFKRPAQLHRHSLVA